VQVATSGTNPGATGGSDTITTANLPSHTHGGGSLNAASSGQHTHNVPYVLAHEDYESSAIGTDFDNTPDGVEVTSSSGAHTHTISGSSAATGSGSNYKPKYYALAYIMKS